MGDPPASQLSLDQESAHGTRPVMNRTLTLLASVLGFSGVALGAFGAHGIKGLLAADPDLALKLGWWETASKYHLIHAVAVGLTAVLATQVAGFPPKAAAGCFAAGIALFSGSLYLMTVTNLRILGAVTPLGGLLLLAGWALVGYSALQLAKS